MFKDDGKTLKDFMPGGVSKDGLFVEGEPVKDSSVPKHSLEEIIERLKTVRDPELPFDIYTLGLIYDIKQEPNADVKINMTLTNPMCPVATQMPRDVARAVADMPNIGVVTVKLVWNPPWSKDQLSPEVQEMLEDYI